MKSKYEIADIIQKFGNEYIKQFNPGHDTVKILLDIAQCRSSVLGGHEEKCDSCGHVRYSYNSCGNRHCPKCLASKQAAWIEALMKKSLKVRHYHVIFTVPHILNSICLYNKALYYKVLFSTVWDTLKTFGYTSFSAETGAVCILHSWGQNLSLHPHIHCIVPAAGVKLNGEWCSIGTNDKYLYPVKQLSSLFRGKFLYRIKQALNKLNQTNNFNNEIQCAYKKSWVVYCESSLASVDHVVKYLGQYTHRVAISNDRILDITDNHVSFIAKDYRDNATKKILKLSGVEFLRRFCQHFLPKRFVKIRYYGIYNHTTKRNLNIEFEPEKHPVNEVIEDSIERVKNLTGFDISQCPKCEKGRMKTISIIPRIRSPSVNVKTILSSLLK